MKLYLSAAALFLTPLLAQQPPEGGPPDGGPPGGFAGRGGPMQQENRKILAQFDKDSNKLLDKEERAAAREFLKANPGQQRGGPGGPGGSRRGPGGPGGFGPREEDSTPATPGARISPADVKPESGDLYAANTLRTFFLDFENADWEAELEAFHGTDVDVPATMTVDGKTYPGVGIHFRGMSSYMMVPAGKKRSFNVSIDHTESKQRLAGYKTLNLLNSNGDGSFLSAVLFSHIARQYIAAPKANLVRVVINGENWGVYVNQQQFNKDFVQENYRTSKGARWKVPGSPNGQGGLDYIGDNIEDYKKRYEMKSGDDEDWKALIKLCKTLTETPADKLEAAISPLLDVESVLWFLALDCGLLNSDGYWTRASDYSLYRDKEGKFHAIPADMNEAFRAAGGPGGPRGGGGGGGRGPGRNGGGPPQGGPDAGGPEGAPAPSASQGGGLKLDPLTGLDDAKKPLRSKLLAVPAFRERYLANIHTLAEKDLDWKNLGTVVARYRELAGKEVAADTRKTSTTEAFENLTSDSPGETEAPRGFGHGGMPLKSFADQRREYLLSLPATAAAGKD
ncbi:CotH kinase family protein [Luteolibacter flavescens]|uniref:CotH kinase family protein n=1 Tax=Luteolibacter flavescens TaxID=1859460 RepID=A0ABT3FVH6_9BACT|nr:CotH kinase family protein [Luteolibacter flavescens]MCW1886975.1 CotH kinase family protein [Luteolibacter flavescens]